MSNPLKKGRALLMAGLLAGTALSGAALPGLLTDAWADTTPARQDAQANPHLIQPAPARGVPDFADLVSQVGPAVVSITSTMRADNEMPRRFSGMMPGMPGTPEGRGRSGQARGSGFLVNANGTIVTNNHVVRDAEKVEVQLADGTRLPARVVGTDPRTDLAVLRVEAKRPLPFLSLGDSGAVRPGQWVVAVGNPFGLGGSVTAGIVSARGRDLRSGPYDDYLQIDAPINAGNSGGPLFSQDGKVVGVNTAILSPSGGNVGIGFAIPANLVRSVVEQLEANGQVTRGYLGVTTQPVTDAMASALRLPDGTRGALVAGVEQDSPAARAGLQAGDVLRAVNGTAVANPHELARAVAGVAPGGKLALDITRDGESRTLTAEAASLPGDKQADAGGGKPGAGKAEAAQDGPRIGVALAPLTPDLREQLDIPARVNGAVVAEVQPGSPAEGAGLRQGDLVLGVGAKAVASPEDAVKAIRSAAKDGSTVALRIMREGRPRFVAVKPGTGVESGKQAG